MRLSSLTLLVFRIKISVLSQLDHDNFIIPLKPILLFHLLIDHQKIKLIHNAFPLKSTSAFLNWEDALLLGVRKMGHVMEPD